MTYKLNWLITSRYNEFKEHTKGLTKNISVLQNIY